MSAYREFFPGGKIYEEEKLVPNSKQAASDSEGLLKKDSYMTQCCKNLP